MSKNQSISVVIAAAGKGSRSGLNYPKCLHVVQGKPIILRLLEVLMAWDEFPNIIASPSGSIPIKDSLLAVSYTHLTLPTTPYV